MEQNRDGTLLVAEPQLKMRVDTLVGVRYYVCIPNNATITEAWLTVTADTTDDTAAVARIRVEPVADSESFTTNPSIIGRFASRAEVRWVIPAFVEGDSYRTADVSPLLAEIRNLPDWDGCGNVLFVFEEVGERDIVAFDGSPTDAVVLNINTNP